MANIKDIAKLAGVSHGTVSNILNGKGNVSVEKIRLVEDVARKLGYSINAKAKMLRKGSTRSLAVILPDIINPHFASFFTGLKNHVESNDYTLQLYLTGDIPSREELALNMIAANRIDGIAVVTCLPGSSPVYDRLESNGIKIVFVERRPEREAGYIGFDYRSAGAEIMKAFIEKGFCRVGIISGLHIHSCEREFYEGFTQQAKENREIQVEEVHVQSEKGMAFRAAFPFFKEAVSPEAIAASNLNLAEGVLSACALGTFGPMPWLVSLAPLGVVSGENTIARYGLNSWMLGQETGKILMDSMGEGKREPAAQILPCDGLRCLESRKKIASKAKTLNVLMLESPSASALMKLAPDFTQKTGVQVKFAVFPYTELYDVIDQMGDKGIYDVIRLDMVWLPWLQRKCLMPLKSLSRDHKRLLGQMLPGIIQDFSMVKGETYAVPFDLSVQLLFYRKDLFEDSMLKRMYYETYRSELAVPTTFEEYNRVASFFTKSLNPNSPVKFGTTSTIGTISGIVCEYLPRLFGFGGGLFDSDGHPILNSKEAVCALENYKESMNYAGPIPENSWWKTSVNNFISGNAAMMIMFINHASDIVNIEKSKVAGMIGYTQVPGKSPLIGGGSLGISRSSANSDIAYDFIEWACGEGISVPFTLLGGVSPCLSVYRNYELMEMVPWLQSAMYGFSIGRRREMWESNGRIVEEHKFEQTLGISIKSAVSGAITSVEAMEHAQHGVEDLIKQQNT